MKKSKIYSKREITRLVKGKDILIDRSMPDGEITFFNEKNMKFVEPIFTPTLWQKIKHFFGNHYYEWNKEGCQFSNCNL